jgi:predicted O-methyltransferase YrrM
MNLEHVSIDLNHIELIYSLIICHKPNNCLEIGIGSGLTTKRIVQAFEYNEIVPNIDCVDNFFDWHGSCPEHIQALKNINITIASEYDFLVSCNKKYDFVISDADHRNTDRWFDKTLQLLNPGGILIYHDVTNTEFPNLQKLIDQTKKLKLNHMLFTKNSKRNERCDRGLLVIQNGV